MGQPPLFRGREDRVYRTLIARTAASARASDGDTRGVGTLWLRWVGVNVVGEIVGFGLAGTLMMLSGEAITSQDGLPQLILGGVAVIAVGLLEGTSVGLAQWTVLRTTFPSISALAWLAATIAGAIVAWGAGMAIGVLAGDALAADDVDMPIAGALVIGAIAGAILAAPQWTALRRAGIEAPWWVPAHAFAWSVGMVVAFAGVAALPSSAAITFTVIAMAGTGLGMGVLVAATTGLALVDAARPRPSRSPARS